MKNIIKGALAVFKKDNSHIERLNICKSCNGGKMTCPICNCFVELKTRVKDEVCPIGKWQ
jgi:hypothetical protein